MQTATPCDNLPYYYYPNYALNHYPPKWYLGILVSINDICTFAQKDNLVETCPHPLNRDREHSVGAVCQYLYQMCQINAACATNICMVYADASISNFICISICSNYTVHLWPEDILDMMESHLLELWAFM